MNRPSFFALVVSAFVPLVFTGCGLQNIGTPEKQTSFLKSTKSDPSQKIARLPFQSSWKDPGLDISKYKYIVVRPVKLAYLRKDQWKDSKSALIPNESSYRRHCAALARYWDKALNKAFSDPLCTFYKTTDTSRHGTLVLEIALTEVRFTQTIPKKGEKPVPVEGIVAAVTGGPICAFEAKTRDADTGKIVVTVADRRGPEIKMITEARTKLAKPNESICDEWSTELMQAGNKDIYPTVKRKWFSVF
jgi:hypothetical protein